MCGGEGIPGEGQGRVCMCLVCAGQSDQASPPGTLSLPSFPGRSECAEPPLAEEFVPGCPGDQAAPAGRQGVTS